MLTLPHLAQVIQTILTDVADAAAQETGFVQRKSKMTGAKFAQTLVFGWLDNPAATYEQLAQTATALGVPITAQGLENRFTPDAAACLKGILERAVQQVMAATPVAIPFVNGSTGCTFRIARRLGCRIRSHWNGPGAVAIVSTTPKRRSKSKCNLI